VTWSLFLDDVRDPPDVGWVVCRSYDAARREVEIRGAPYRVSFDHDLGENSISGYDFAKWLCSYMLEHGVSNEFTYYVHSMNPIGAVNIDRYVSWFVDTYRSGAWS
jgi:hypothetical protein